MKESTQKLKSPSQQKGKDVETDDIDEEGRRRKDEKHAKYTYEYILFAGTNEQENAATAGQLRSQKQRFSKWYGNTLVKIS